eukprot:2708513-Heterocapsa_arctica.AAC.1
MKTRTAKQITDNEGQEDKTNNRFRADPAEIEAIGSGVVNIPVEMLYEEPDGQHRQLSERPERGRAR